MMPAHNGPAIDPLAFGAEPGQAIVGGQPGMGSDCGGAAAVLRRTPGSGGTDDPAVDRGGTGVTDSGGAAQPASPS
jgi:hypothetical protein